MRNLVADAKDFGSLGDYGDLAKIPDGEIPTYYYDFLRTNLPMTDAEYDAAFGPTVTLFSESPEGSAANPNHQTNTATGTSVNEPFVACGLGVLAMGEGEAFSVPGITGPVPAGGFPAGALTPTIAMSVAVLDYGYFCGSASLTAAFSGALQHAVLWWGAPTWRFIEKFFQAYRLQLAVGRRFLLVDESLFDVGMAPVPPEFVGASESLYPTMPFIRAVNGVMQAKGFLRAFSPVTVAVDNEGVQGSVAPPMVPVTYGHPRIVGLSHKNYNFRNPLAFLPGMRFSIDFVQVVPETTFPELRNTVTANCSTIAENVTNIVAINDIPLQFGASCTIPGGQISLGVVLKGLSLQPQACAQYLTDFVPRDSICERMYRECGLGVAPFVQEMLAREKTGRLHGWLQGK